MKADNLKHYAAHLPMLLAAAMWGLAVRMGKRCVAQLVAARVCDGVILLQWYAVGALTKCGAIMLRLAARIAAQGT